MEQKERPSKDQYYLNIAKEVGARATCFVKIGAVIVREDQIISTGYNGAPRGTRSCLEKGYCLRRKKDIPSGTQYELCTSVHAEQNAIINSARSGVSLLNGDIYIYGEMNGQILKALPCFICKKMIINAGIRRVICSNPPNPDGFEIYSVEKWKEEWREKDLVDDPEIYGINFPKQ